MNAWRGEDDFTALEFGYRRYDGIVPMICRHALSADIECTRLLGKKRSFYATLLDGAQSRLKRCEARAAEAQTREFNFNESRFACLSGIRVLAFARV